MPWPRGKRRGPQTREHREKIRASVLSTVPLRRKMRTKAQRARDIELDPASIMKNVLTAPKKDAEQIKVYGERKREEVQTILNGRIKLAGHGKAFVRVGPAAYETDSRGRPVSFV